MRKKKLSLPQLLINNNKIDTKKVVSSIISRFEEIGIPSNISVDRKNAMEEFIKIMTEENVESIKKDMK